MCNFHFSQKKSETHHNDYRLMGIGMGMGMGMPNEGGRDLDVLDVGQVPLVGLQRSDKRLGGLNRGQPAAGATGMGSAAPIRGVAANTPDARRLKPTETTETMTLVWKENDGGKIWQGNHSAPELNARTCLFSLRKHPQSSGMATGLG